MKEYKYVGTVARTEPVIMAPGDVVMLEPEQAEPLLKEKFLIEVAEQESPSATEAAQRLADEEGIDLSTVEGTGVNGRITHEDVHAAIVAQKGTESHHEEGEQA